VVVRRFSEYMVDVGSQVRISVFSVERQQSGRIFIVRTVSVRLVHCVSLSCDDVMSCFTSGLVLMLPIHDRVIASCSLTMRGLC